MIQNAARMRVNPGWDLEIATNVVALQPGRASIPEDHRSEAPRCRCVRAEGVGPVDDGPARHPFRQSQHCRIRICLGSSAVVEDAARAFTGRTAKVRHQEGESAMQHLIDIGHETATQLRILLLDMARHQDDLAADEAASTPYWQPHPMTVHGHRSAADALRAEADLLIGGAS